MPQATEGEEKQRILHAVVHHRGRLGPWSSTWDVWQAAKKASRDMEVWLARPSEAVWAAMPSAMNLSTSSFSAASFTPELAGSASSMKSCTYTLEVCSSSVLWCVHDQHQHTSNKVIAESRDGKTKREHTHRQPSKVMAGVKRCKTQTSIDAHLIHWHRYSREETILHRCKLQLHRFSPLLKQSAISRYTETPVHQQFSLLTLSTHSAHMAKSLRACCLTLKTFSWSSIGEVVRVVMWAGG